MTRCCKEGRNDSFWLTEGIQSVTAVEIQWQKHEVAGHIVSVVKKRGERDKHWCSAHFSFLVILGPQPRDGPAHIQGRSPPQLNLSGTPSDTLRWVIPE